MEETCYILVSDTGFVPENKDAPQGVCVLRTESFAKKVRKQAEEPLSIFSVSIGDKIVETENMIKTNKFTVLSEID